MPLQAKVRERLAPAEASSFRAQHKSANQSTGQSAQTELSGRKSSNPGLIEGKVNLASSTPMLSITKQDNAHSVPYYVFSSSAL